MSAPGTPVRVLVAKPGLDGHDRGAKLVARALRDAGFEVIYTGIRQKPEAIASIALQEDVDLVGLSILSGCPPRAHPQDGRGAAVPPGSATSRSWSVGPCPQADVEALLDIGAAAVFPTGTPIETLVAEVRALTTG